jgi:hypothetical protein
MFKNWMRLTRDAMLLGMETQRVMGLRLMKLSRGGRPAEAEALRMVTEKTNALMEAGMTLTRGGSAERRAPCLPCQPLPVPSNPDRNGYYSISYRSEYEA